MSSGKERESEREVFIEARQTILLNFVTLFDLLDNFKILCTGKCKMHYTVRPQVQLEVFFCGCFEVVDSGQRK